MSLFALNLWSSVLLRNLFCASDGVFYISPSLYMLYCIILIYNCCIRILLTLHKILVLEMCMFFYPWNLLWNTVLSTDTNLCFVGDIFNPFSAETGMFLATSTISGCWCPGSYRQVISSHGIEYVEWVILCCSQGRILGTCTIYRQISYVR